ncbi:hypothetical protein BT96DRAFT_40049 [Gymnopus androsaceus JB14]|uniref:Uncharacterized protein n=1 Tax=Gymnopus androsaceus JB14 TaxID=1447944 RepID=A0A6A4HL98_9AGAR|nr:hypothetical protein BT96DRAFT_40049 [Gymnopus androsaceus JB14]
MQCTGEELVACVQTFLELLWEKQHNGESLSWEDVSQSPMNFYDKQNFDLPIKLSHPRNMGAGVFIFAEYLKGPGSLFRFLEQTARNEEKAVAPTPMVVPSQLSSTTITTSTPAAAPSQPSSTTVVVLFLCQRRYLPHLWLLNAILHQQVLWFPYQNPLQLQVLVHP